MTNSFVGDVFILILIKQLLKHHHFHGQHFISLAMESTNGFAYYSLVQQIECKLIFRIKKKPLG